METIYYLSISDIPFYVGKTRKTLRQRLARHIFECKKQIGANPRKNRKIQEAKLDVQINEIEIVAGDQSTLAKIEEYWIWQFKAWGFPITNKEGHRSSLKINKEKYPWHQMEVGDSFQFSSEKLNSAYASCRQYNKKLSAPIKITMREIEEGQYRCWRVE